MIQDTVSIKATTHNGSVSNRFKAEQIEIQNYKWLFKK